VVFLRTESGTDRRHDLWVFDVDDRVERRVAEAAALLRSGGEDLTAAERARRERMRVGTSGIVAYSTDREMTAAVFALSSRLFHVSLLPDGDSHVREISATLRSTRSSTSKTHRSCRRSVPLSVRRNTTRLPSELTLMFRGAPRVKFIVRAASRGKPSSPDAAVVSVIRGMYRPVLATVTLPIAVSTRVRPATS
jgi:hypothetical protein